EAIGRAPLLPWSNLEEPQLPARFLPRLRLWIGGKAHKMHRRARHALEPLEVHPQDAEIRWPALLQAVELIVPVVGAGKQVAHYADPALPARASLDAPLGRHGW